MESGKKMELVKPQVANGQAWSWLRIPVMFIYCVVNFALLLLLVSTLYRFFPFDNPDFQKIASIVSGIVSFAAMQRFVVWMFGSEFPTFSSFRDINKKPILLLNLLIALITLVLHVWGVPRMSQWHFERGNTAYDEGRFASSLESFQKAIKINPKHLQAHIAIARVYETLNDFDNALKHFQLGITKIDKPYSAYNELARLYLADEKTYPQALDFLQKIRKDLDSIQIPSQEENDVTALVYKNLAWVYFKLKLYGDSAHYIIKSIELMKKTPNAFTRHPEVFCLYGLISQAAPSALPTNSSSNQKCSEARDQFQGRELELYIEFHSNE